jgi:glycosyltransferase involved in cell wall biosynthesis
MLNEMFDIADRFVLLSTSYIKELCKITKTQDISKTVCINNPLTFHNPKVDFTQKKKQVLILSRLEDFQKNISSALRIWKLIENSKFHDWKLVIVGSGVDEKKLQNYAKELNLKSYTFIGETSKPEKYYQESSIFMMTSHIEGWPMTLPEAQQFGCIPIVFNTFAALSEIIENGVNGNIVEKKDEKLFAKKLLELMENTSLRQEIAEKCISKSQEFSSKAIGDKWDLLLRAL